MIQLGKRKVKRMEYRVTVSVIQDGKESLETLRVDGYTKEAAVKKAVTIVHKLTGILPDAMSWTVVKL